MSARCLALLSGGLDSTLAARVLLEQGVDVVGVTMASPFFGADRGVRAAGILGIEHRVVDITDELIPVVRAPRHGYGRFMNPCIDCHALMVRTCARMMKAERADFVATGEVLGERPKSQHGRALRCVEKDGGLPGRVLRPLSARLLPETVPEREGLVDRHRLHDFKGRSRAAQFALAEHFGIAEYPNPGGGCRLADPSFSGRLTQLLRRHPGAEGTSYRLLSLGRHAWDQGALVVVGRDREENARVEALAQPGDVLMRLVSTLGPTTLVRWPTAGAVDLAVTMTARYSQERDREAVPIDVWTVESGGVRRVVSRAHVGRRDFAVLP